MSGQLIFFIVVVSLFGGIALTGFAVFLYVFYQAIKRLTVVAEAVHAVIEPMSGGNLLPDILRAFRETNKMGKDIVASVGGITTMMHEFNKLMAASSGAYVPPVETARTAGAVDLADQESFFVAPTEAEQAHGEDVSEARKAGIPVEHDGASDSEPPLAGMVGSQV